MSGKVNALAEWFMQDCFVNGPEHDFIRDEMLMKITDGSLIAFGCEHKVVCIVVEGARFLIEDRVVSGVHLINFTCVPSDRLVKYNFWMNASSVIWVGDLLRRNHHKRADFNFLFCNHFE